MGLLMRRKDVMAIQTPGATKAMNGIQAPRLSGRAGFTLIEVMVSIAIFVMLALSSLYFVASQVAANRVTRLRVDANNTLRAKVEEMLTAANIWRGADDGSTGAHNGTAKGMIRFLRHIQTEVASRGANYPIRVTEDTTAGTATYTFLVSHQGTNTPATSALAGLVTSTSNPLAIGTITLFLNESRVPAEFHSWNDLSSTNPATPGGIAGFDMDGDGLFTRSFTLNLPDNTPLYAIPARADIQYYRNAQDLAARSGALYSTERFFLINDATLGKDSIFTP